MSIFVVSYVWQNIEVMKIKMSFARQHRIEQKIIEDIDSTTYEIEKYKTIKHISAIAEEKGFSKITLENMEEIK